jgi:NDP-sugar pyrophosphorylase family protein
VSESSNLFLPTGSLPSASENSDPHQLRARPASGYRQVEQRGRIDDGRPFFLHNVDVLSDIDLLGLLRHHQEAKALATLAVQSRSSSRVLLFDRDGRLCGRETP